ncbi:N-lysine methyltransferase SMYD2-B-like [Paramacrobiotus metropolitanus]|uniref:N-lysine methyltransferase SMYD2-B-like n=1 Tax=Paramacrobiotus metropolitanus TaxID=2943436 RepID=UPI0024459495|nr:N-lysine methyltransferase SMYD2-B-like [Paramacrobiotus metropolitanus]
METQKTVPSAGTRSFVPGDIIIACDPLVWALERSAYITRCAYCLDDSPELRKCSGCQLHRYCNAVCQAADWKVEHKLECSVLKNSSNNASRTYQELASILPAAAAESSSLPMIIDMIAKLDNKVRRNTMMDITGFGRKSAKDLLFMLPTDPSNSAAERMRLPVMLASTQLTILGLPVSDFLTYYAILQHNFVPVCDVLANGECVGLAVYPQVSRRQMTPVCWDINVVLNCRGRQLVVHAVENIPNYTGLQDFSKIGL